jgi:hypothetical protein
VDCNNLVGDLIAALQEQKIKDEQLDTETVQNQQWQGKEVDEGMDGTKSIANYIAA